MEIDQARWSPGSCSGLHLTVLWSHCSGRTQAIAGVGWNAVTFNYRGSWGSPGSFRFAQSLQDADAVLAYLRVPATATKLGIDTDRIAIAGHGMGGWVAAPTASHDHRLIGAVLISTGDSAAWPK